MNTLSKLILSLVVFVSIAARAQSIECVGMDGTGKTYHVIADPSTDTLNVNGEIHKAQFATKGGNGVATESYQIESGKIVYDSFVIEGKDKATLYQWEVDTNKIIASMPLACHANT